MNKIFQRTMSLLLALITVVTLLPMVPMEAEAAENPYPDQTITIAKVSASEKSPSSYSGPAKTYADVYAIVNDYYNTVSQDGKKTAHWNAGIRQKAGKDKKAVTAIYEDLKKEYSSILNNVSTNAKEYLKRLPFLATITDSDCKAKDKVHKYDEKGLAGCSSNYFGFKFEGGETNGNQCLGFANYMAYVVFKGNVSEYKKIKGNALLNYKVKPGDLLRVPGNPYHSMFVYRVDGNKAYVIEGNENSRCSIDMGDKVTVDTAYLKTLAENSGCYILSSPAIPSLAQYTIKFDANKPSGAAKLTGTMADQKAWVGAAANLTANTYKIENYVFQGWNTQKDGKGTGYKDKNAVTNLATEDGATVTLYAQWMSKEAYDYLKACSTHASSLRAKVIVDSDTQNMKSLPCSWNTCKESKTIRALKKGETLTVTELRKNKEGNYWYKVKADADGAEGYVFHAHIEVSAENTVNFNVKLARTENPKGKTNPISGTVTSRFEINYVKGLLRDSAGNEQEKTEKRKNKFTDIGSSYIDDLGFKPLSRGKGTLTLSAELNNNFWYDAGKGTHTRVIAENVINFTVVGQYNVKFSSNTTDTVTNMPGTQKKTDCAAITLSSNVPVRKDYTFLGWAKDKNAAKEEYKAGAKLTEDSAAGDLTLYAVWKRNTVNSYTVQYDKNGGAGTMAASSFQPGKTVKLAKNAFTREGYVFTGWNTKSDGTGTAYGNEASVKDLAAKGDSIKLYAQWTNTYRVVYHPNASDWLGDDISGNMTPSRFEVGKSYSLPANPYKRTHTNILGKKTTYVFLGWTTNSDGTGTLYENKATVTNLSSKPGVDVNLYAKWAKPDEVFTVKYDKNGGTGTMENTIILLDTDTALRKNAFTRSNYKFEKWTTNSDGTGSSYTDGQSVKNLTKGGSSITLYAKWKSTAKTYTVQYQPNGGTGTTKSSSHTVGVAARLTTNGFTREGYIFDSWNTKADGSGTKYTNAQSVTDLTTTNKATVSLYAQWREMTEAEYLKSCTKYASCMNLTVSNGSGNLMARPVNSGTVTRQLISGETMVSTALYKNSKGEYWYQVRANRDGKTGYIYAGNAFSKGIANRNVSFGVTLESYSILKGYKCDILGSVSAQNDILYKVTGVLDDSDPKTAAQTNSISSGFANLKATTLNTKLAFASLSRGKGTLTLTAMLRSAWSDGKNLRWEEFTTEEYPIEFTVRGIYQVVYDSNTTDPVKQMPSNQNKQDAQDLTLSANIPVRTGYTFLGWAKEEDADKVDYLPGDVLKEDSATGNLTLFALWDGPNKYTITFDPNGGTGGPGKATATYGTDFYYPAKYPSLAGCTFLGWSRNKDVDGNADDASKYLLKAPQLFEKDTTLYAVWKRSPVNIYFYHNDGSGKISTQTILANMDHTLPDARQFSRTGYTMIGYSDVSGATTPKYLPGEAFTTGTDKILYLVWKVSSWKVSFHANGGIGAPEDQEKVYGTDLLLTTAVPTRTGYTFLGWAETPDAEQPTYYPGDIYGKNADLTLFAVWEKNSSDTEIHYTVTYADFGGSNGPGSAVKIHGVDLLLSDIYPVRENYRFLGWSREANVTVAEFPAGETCYYTEDADIILYAIWERLPVLVYDVNSGKYWQSNAETATEVEAFDCSDLAHITVKLNPSEMLRSWYAPTEDAPERSIQDWYDQFVFAVDLSVGLQIKNDQFDFYISKREGYECRNSITGIEQISFLEDENLVFNIFVLTHDLQGGWLKGNPGSKGPFYDLFWNNYPYWGEGYDQWEKDGYTLIGWSREPNAVTAELPVSFDWNFDEDTVVYAVWQKNENEPVTYSVTYDDNGGSNGPGSDVKKHGEDLQVSVVCPEREHYRFLGWARSADASVPEFQVGEYCWYTEDADIILYAVWEPITYTVFYNTLFGTGYPESQIKYDGQPLILSSVIPTRQGYDFLGWGVNDDGHGVDYRPGDVFELDETVDMYAIWELAPTRVYDVNAGKYWEIEESIATEAEPFDYSNLVHIIITLNPSETIRSWYAPTEEDPERSVQEWYDSYEFAVELSDAYLQNKGNQFDFYISKGTYSCRNNVNSALNFDFLENEDLTFDIYVLTIDPQGGYYHDNVNDTAVSTALFCGNYPYDRGFAHSWTKEGYTFLGWSRDPNATVAEYPEVFPWDFDEDTTIYAVWQ